MQDNKNTQSNDDLRDRKFAEGGLIRGLILDPIRFEMWQNMTKNAVKFSRAYDMLTTEINNNPKMLLDEYEKVGELGTAFNNLLSDKLKDVEIGTIDWTQHISDGDNN